MYENKIVKRIPGAPPIPASEKQGYLDDLRKLSMVQLTELIERQNSLLRNKGFIERLPDRGVKISAFKSRIESELKHRREVHNTDALFGSLSLNGPVEEIEWTGSYSSLKSDRGIGTTNTGAKADDGDVEAIRILASHGRTSYVERNSESHERLTEDNASEGVVIDPYAKALCKKMSEKSLIPARESFKPFRTLRSSGKSSAQQRASPSNTVSESHVLQNSVVAETGDDKETSDANVEQVKRTRHWEVTAATPPPPIYGTAQMLALEESIALEKAAMKKRTEARATQSMMRLAEQLQRASLVEYRDTKGEESSDEEEDDICLKKELTVEDEEDERFTL